MKVLVTGFKGQLGYDVIRDLTGRGIECKGVDIDDFDITNDEQTESYIKEYNPTIVVHCSAFTAVDLAEKESEKCYKVNVDGPENIAKACKKINAAMFYISTDYVYPGTGECFYEVGDKTGPLSAYGRTKLMGEQKVQENLEKYFIVRISWAFGINGNNFIKTMLRLGETHDEITVVNDQVGSPTYTKDLAVLIGDMLLTEKYGIYQATNEGICSFAEFAEEIFRQAGLNTKVKHVTTEEYGSDAVRPKNSRMSKDKLVKQGFNRLPDWKDALSRYLVELGVK